MSWKTVVCVFLVSIILAGCATVWDKPGLNATDLRRDAAECKRDADQILDKISLTPWDAYLQRQQIMNRCMEARGYTKE